MNAQPVLATKGVSKRFGDFVAVNNVDFELIEKETLGIIGPNGAGKTTFINLLTGFYIPEQGQVFSHGENITHLSPASRVNLGIVRTFQLVHVFDNLTVADNLGLAYFRKKEGKPYSFRMFYTSLRQSEFAGRIEETLEMMELAPMRNEVAANLSRCRFAAHPAELLGGVLGLLMGALYHTQRSSLAFYLLGNPLARLPGAGDCPQI